MRQGDAGRLFHIVTAQHKRFVYKEIEKGCCWKQRYQKYVEQSLHGFNGKHVDLELRVKTKPEELFL